LVIDPCKKPSAGTSGLYPLMRWSIVPRRARMSLTRRPHAVLVSYCHTNTFLSQARPNMAKILIITFLKVQRVGIAGHVLGKSWTNIYALTEVIRGLPFARIRWRSLAKTTSVGMLQSQVAGASRRESGRWCLVELKWKASVRW
jgi:hypothetical protein